MKESLLIADCDEKARMQYKELLEKEGYNVIFAKNGQQTLERIEDEHIDLVLLDIKMPDINGMDVLLQIVKKNAHLPVLINTAFLGYIEDCRSWIAEDYIIKSADLLQLLNKIKEVLLRKTKKQSSIP